MIMSILCSRPLQEPSKTEAVDLGDNMVEKGPNNVTQERADRYSPCDAIDGPLRILSPLILQML